MNTTEYKKRLKPKTGQIIAVSANLKDADGDPLHRIFLEKDFERDYGQKYGWKKISNKSAPVKKSK